MLNKSKFKTFLKNGMATKLIFDKNSKWVSDGYAAYSTNIGNVPSAIAQVREQYSNDQVKTQTAILDINQLADVDHRDSLVLSLTQYIEESGNYLNRVFIDENGEKRLCQQKYLDVLGDFKKYKYTQNSEFSPIFIWENGTLIAFILPVRVNDSGNYNVFRFDTASKLAEAQAKIKELEAKVRRLSPEPVIVLANSFMNTETFEEIDECIPF